MKEYRPDNTHKMKGEKTTKTALKSNFILHQVTPVTAAGVIRSACH